LVPKIDMTNNEDYLAATETCQN